jgi:phosphohistidine phosphatase SixA
MQIAAILIVIALVVIWFLTDKVVYRGEASVIANNMKHYSTTHKTVMVVPHKSGSTSGILVATVTNAKAASIAASLLAKRQITVRKRLFGKPRVTSVS